VTDPDHSDELGPLSDDELDALADLLEEHGASDFDATIGFLHGVTVAPGPVAPTRWVPKLVPDTLFEAGEEGAKMVDLLMRLHHEVHEGLHQGHAWMPGTDEPEALARFATGYVHGAELDPTWMKSADRLALLAPFAFLAGRLDLVPEDAQRMFGEDAGRALALQQLGALVLQTYTAFRGPAHVPHIGRNDPCPCGSGKKYKKCCGA
jgi:yecA family protein